MASSMASDERLLAEREVRIAELAGVLNLANARLTAVMADVLDDESWSGPGVHSPAQWLAWKAGVSPERARAIVRVAGRRSEFPSIIGAFDAGELSLEQVVELVKAPAWADAEILHWGKVATVSRLRRTMRAEWFAGDPDEPPAPEASPDDGDHLATGTTDDRRWRIRGATTLDRGATIDAALAAAREALAERGHVGIGRMHCLDEVCATYLDAVDVPLRRDRCKTWVHLEMADGSARLTDGCRLPDHVRDLLLCDGLIQPVWEREGLPFSVGRTQRIVPERTRRIVLRRDRGCRVPGCTHDRFVEIHHILHWTDGGPTDTWNLLSLCPKHHRLHHLGKLGISGNADEPDGVVVTDWRGRVLEPVGQPTPPTGDPPGPATPYQPPLAGRVDYQWVGLGWVHPSELRRRRAAAAERGELPPRALVDRRSAA